MKNVWFIFIGMLAVFALFFVMFTDWSFGSLQKSPTLKKVKVPNHTNTAMIITPHDASSGTHNKPSLTKETTQPNTQEKILPEDEQIYKEKLAESASEEIESKSIQKPIVKTTTLNINSAIEVKMKIKAKERDGIVKAKVGITHEMLTYKQAKKKGREANFITHITALVAKRVVYDISTSQFLSKNPLLKFTFKGQKGEELTIIYQQLKGETFYASKKIK